MGVGLIRQIQGILYTMLSIFKQSTLDDNEEIKAKVFSQSKVGHLVPVTLLGSENGYYIITGYEHESGLTAPKKLEDEAEIEYIARLKPISLQGFADLQAETLEAINLTNEQLLLLLKQPEFKQSET